MIENQEYLRINDSIIHQTISGVCFELNKGDLKGFLNDLDNFINLLLTYPGDLEKHEFFINKLIENVRFRHSFENYTLFFYHLNEKLSEYYYFSNNLKKAIEHCLIGIRNIYNNFDGNLQVLIEVLKLKLFVLQSEKSNSIDDKFKQEIETIFIEILNSISNKNANIFINGHRIKKSSFHFIKTDLMELSMIISLLDDSENDYLYKRIEEIIIRLKYYKFKMQIFCKIFGDFLKIK